MIGTVASHIRNMLFRSGEDGAVTVDWVVLTAALVMLGIGAAFYISSSVPEIANKISTYMDDVTVVPD